MDNVDQESQQVAAEEADQNLVGEVTGEQEQAAEAENTEAGGHEGEQADADKAEQTDVTVTEQTEDVTVTEQTENDAPAEEVTNQEQTEEQAQTAQEEVKDNEAAEVSTEEPAQERVDSPTEEPQQGTEQVSREDVKNENNNAGDEQETGQEGEASKQEEDEQPAQEAEEEAATQQEEKTGEDGELNVPDMDNKGQQTTPAPTPHEEDTPGQEQEEGTTEVQAEEGEEEEDEEEEMEEEMEEKEEQMQDEAEEDDTAEMLDKQTPVPPTEDMGTGTGDGQVVTEAGDQEQSAPADPHVTSPMPQFDKDATATVKFVLLPTQQVATLRCNLTQSLYDLKQHFAQELKIPASTILLMLDGKGTSDRMSLGELGVGPNGTIRLEMQSADPENQPITAFKPRQEYTMPDVISVRVQSDGVMKDVVVEIERSARKKPFLGGYRHKKTGVEYHHASAQTMQKPRPPPAVERFCRDTQTVQQKHVPQQTTNDMSTQMTKIGVYVANMKDKLVVPGKYTTADDYRLNILNQVVVIQKYYRRWLSKRYVEKVREDKKECEEWERQEEIRKKEEKEDRIRREFERRMNPKTKEDFDLLYNALEKWRLEEMNNINENLSGAERKAALCSLLEQETQLITSIGRHKLEADGENKQKHVQKFLDSAASAKKWRGPDGKMTEMDTPYTIRAQELRDIYNSINMKYLTQDERLDVLLTLKHTVKEHDCKLTQEIIQLIDREADLLMRGVKESNLDGLRKRISTLFLQYCKTPTFNPEAARLLKVPQDPSTLRKNIYFCPSCNQYLPSTDFGLSSNSRAVGKCRKCTKIDNDARVRQDYSHYRFMLKGVRRSEESYEDESKIAFLMQENDLRYLVENIWNSQSVLSAWDDLYDLVLVRWDQHEEWSPWNSILLTKEEASAHEKLESLEEAYGKVFVHKVKHKHTLARNYFSRMPGMAEHMRSRNDSALPNGPMVSGKSLTMTPTLA